MEREGVGWRGRMYGGEVGCRVEREGVGWRCRVEREGLG